MSAPRLPMTTPIAEAPDESPPRAGAVLARDTTPSIDVSSLPSVVFGKRDKMWWGTAGFMIVEGVTMAVVVASFLYVRLNFDQWPPPRTSLPDLTIGTVNLALLLLSLWPNVLLDRASKRLDESAVRRWLWVGTAFGGITLALRMLELGAVNTAWNTDAYGSVVWAVLITHATLLLVDFVEMGVSAMVFTLRRHEAKHFTDASNAAGYEYFLVLAWIPQYVLIYLYPRWG